MAESSILAMLPRKVGDVVVLESKVRDMNRLHNKSDATRAYKSPNGWTPGHKFGTGNSKHMVYGYTLEEQHNLNSHPPTVDTRYLECVQDLRPYLAKQIGTQSEACAYAVSFHYTKEKDGKDSAHTVGFFFSRGTTAQRSFGGRFFDPNVGSWKFAKLDELLDFATNDWLRCFAYGTINPDPGKAQSRRTLNFYRVVLLVSS